ncbi:MAG TPA: 2OG-Fe dioxygenase family protein [Vicinamibacterales bacterium]|jgi:hypothetical protein|nr:2OG-Fe dioxygenase family protein [Vicinamibacterales bacterium]
MTAVKPDHPLRSAIVDEGYAFVRAPEMRLALAPIGPLTDWTDFAASWNDLELDTYLADRGRYRKRRFAVYGAAAGGPITRQDHQPHYQSRDYNQLFGGIARWFAPISSAVGGGSSMLTILGFCRSLFEGLAPAVTNWHIEVHQFRIEARSDVSGQPTPEGVHRDGVDFVLVLLVNRHNIVSGTTTVFGLERQPLGSFTLIDPFDAALVDDARVYHGVTPVTPLDPAVPAYRDVLVVTLKRSPGLS